MAKAPPALESLLPGVPSIVARLVERCLEKAPEQRYQTAQGLAADLEWCLRRLQESGQIEPFALGHKDFSPKLQIPQTLVSRQTESQAVTAAFDRAARGAVEVLLLGGPSGVGKTALVRAVYRDIAQAGRGLLLSGKHDQLGRAVPYAALAQAFSGWMSSLAASPKPVFDAWRARLDQALGPLLRVIADLVPELEWLMGPLPALPVVPTEMTYNRIKLSWIEFVRAVTDASPPLVLFLDDLQWVDPASLELLKTLLTDVGRKNLLVIAAFRDNEVPVSHPLWNLVEAVSASGIHTPRLTLGPLDEAAVQTWLAGTLSALPERVEPLGTALYRKTQGNPFFLGQLLLELYRQKRVRRNLEDGQWQWDQDAVERAAVTDNVVELMRRKVVELPAPTQELLGQAACAGHSFSFDELMVLTGLPPAQGAHQLWPALLAGLVVPVDGQYRASQALALAQQGAELDARYRFLHDRVQQAFYERIAPEQRARTHLQIGRRLQTVFQPQGDSNQKRLELVRHLNLGAGALETEAARQELAQLNLQAAKAAKENGSYRLQATLVEQAQQLLGERAWHKEPQLSVELALERIEADFMLREFAQVHQRAQVLLALPLPALPRLAAQELRVRTCLATGQYGEGERLGVAALAEQGITYPESNDECVALALQLIGECDAWLDRHPDGFGSMPVDPSLAHLLCDALETAVGLCATFGNRIVLGVVGMARNVKQVTERAVLTVVTPLLIAMLAPARSVLLGEYRGGVRWAREGERAATRLAAPVFPQVACVLGFSLPHELPVERSREHYRAAFRTAAVSGSLQGTSWALSIELSYVDLWGGHSLGQVAEKEQGQRDVVARAGDALGQSLFALTASYAAFLRTSLNARPAPGADWLTASSRSFVATGDGLVTEVARILESHLFLAFGEWDRAFERAEEAERFRPAIHGAPFVTDIPLWRGLAAAKCCAPTLTQEQRAPLLAILAHSIERFRYFSEGCAENFLHKLRLLEAEYARLHGHTDEALAHYEETITRARHERFLHIEALAAQFCGEFHLTADRPRLASLYLHQARDAYSRWDAVALVTFLEQKYPALLREPVSADRSAERARTVTATTHTAGDVALDVNTTVRSAQALARELDPHRVVAELMRLVQENAGAQGAALLLCAQDSLSVSALLSGSQIRAGLAEPLAASHPVAPSIVQYVLRSREPLVLSDALTDSRFAHDPHLLAAAIRSVLAVPLVHQGRLGGILYLEHQTANAFPPARVHLVGVLAAQSAIALENARLYAELQAANAGLEAKVHERTAALDKALKELWSEMDLAQKIQTVLCPTAAQIPGYELAAVMRPADQVGGDYYDVFRWGAQDLVLIGDVSGHGVTAGLCMMMIQTALRTAAWTLERAHQPLTPSRLLALVDQAVRSNLQQIGRNQYMTLTALCIQGGSVRYAGLHQDLLIYRATSQTVERIETQGVWLGVTEDDLSELLQDHELQLHECDVLLLYTDGYTEATVAGQRLETAGLSTIFAQLCAQALPCAALIQGLLTALQPAVVQDDVTLVALRRRHEPTEHA